MKGREVVLGLLAAAATYTLVADAVERRNPASVRRAAPGQSLVALSFDDGPHPELTPRVLDLLGQAGARATFFMVGENVRRHPDLARRACAEGHALGVHTDTHRHAWLLGPGGLRGEMRRCRDAIADATGLVPLWFRPPWGSFNALTRRTANELGLRIALWSCDAGDWLPGATPDAILGRAGRGLRDGAIIDLHDGGRTPAGCRAMVAALPAILRAAQAAGLRPAHLGELFGLPAMGASA